MMSPETTEVLSGESETPAPAMLRKRFERLKLRLRRLAEAEALLEK
jgi:hypothetical protein